jgi:UDP-N-acetyl-D-galactosamine dehydrogenase
LGVSHKDFLSIDINAFRNKNSILYDVKGILGDIADGKL